MNPSMQPLVKVDHLQQLTRLHISCLVQNAFLLSSCWIPDPWSVWIFLHHYYQLWIPRKDPPIMHPFLSCEWVKVTQSCPTFCNPDYTVHGILQARILEWVAVSFSRESSQPRDWTQVSSIEGWFFTSWATREAVTQDAGMGEAKGQFATNFSGSTLCSAPSPGSTVSSSCFSNSDLQVTEEEHLPDPGDPAGEVRRNANLCSVSLPRLFWKALEGIFISLERK